MEMLLFIYENMDLTDLDILQNLWKFLLKRLFLGFHIH